MTTALEGGEGPASRPRRSLPPGKTRYPLYMRLGGPQGQSGQVRKISPPPEFDPRTVQLVASRYTVYANWPTIFVKHLPKILREICLCPCYERVQGNIDNNLLFLSHCTDPDKWSYSRSGRFIPVKIFQNALNRRLSEPYSRSGYFAE